MVSSTLHRSARFRPASVAPAARRNPLELLLLQLQGKKASGGGAALLAAWLAGCGSRSCCITASSSDRERDLRIPVSLPAVPRASPGRSLQSERSRSSPPLVPAAAVKKPGADFSFLPRSPRGGRRWLREHFLARVRYSSLRLQIAQGTVPPEASVVLCGWREQLQSGGVGRGKGRLTFFPPLHAPHQGEQPRLLQFTLAGCPAFLPLPPSSVPEAPPTESLMKSETLIPTPSTRVLSTHKRAFVVVPRRGRRSLRS